MMAMMTSCYRSLSIDIETYSGADLSVCGVYKYVESPDFEVLLFGYSLDNSDVKVIDLAQGEPIPGEVIRALKDDTVIKWAFNSSFERICLSRYLKTCLSPQSWRCSQVWSAYLGLPLFLKEAGRVLNLEKQKLDEGKKLIKVFCTPQHGRQIKACELPEMWEQFKKYNKRDVEVEIAIKEKLKAHPVPEAVWDEYTIHQEINDRGVLIDRKLVENALKIDSQIRKELETEIRCITGVENPNSTLQLKKWFQRRGITVDSLDKKAVQELIGKVPEKEQTVLKLRQQLAKSSVRKYEAMISCVCEDGRVKGMFKFYGANRSGRSSGRLVQLQNLPQNHMSTLDSARELVKSGNYEALKLLYDDIPDTLSQLIRTAFIPEKPCHFAVSDFSAIEARVIAWLAGEKWRMKAFADGKDIYCESASKMFHVPVEKNGINGHLRAKGKVAELACGYGGSVGALKNMGAAEMGLTEQEMQKLISDWRKSNTNIVKLWRDFEEAVLTTVAEGINTSSHGINFELNSDILFITLPSGRKLSYVRPRIETGRFGRDCVTYEGVNTGHWTRLETYGGKIVENVVQAISRDILYYAIKNLRNYKIEMHIHDEVVIETNEDLEVICSIMSKTPPWAEGLILRADGYVCNYYIKE